MVAIRWTLVLIAVALAGAVLAATVQAKTMLDISPSSGPGGTVVRVVGEGFCGGEVSVVLSLSNLVDPGASAGSFVPDPSLLPPSMPLASVSVLDGSFETTFVMPTRDEVTAHFGQKPTTVYVLAVQPGHEGCSEPDETFVIGAAYTFSGPDLVTTGIGASTTSRSPTVGIASLVAAGVVLLVGGYTLRRGCARRV